MKSKVSVAFKMFLLLVISLTAVVKARQCVINRQCGYGHRCTKNLDFNPFGWFGSGTCEAGCWTDVSCPGDKRCTKSGACVPCRSDECGGGGDTFF